MKKWMTLLPALVLSAALWAQPSGRQSFNEGWRFRQVPSLTEREAAADFNDFGWRTVDLPHDWGVEEVSDLPGVTGTSRLNDWGKAWYRKHFTVSESDLRGKLRFEMDGALKDATVWVNGACAGNVPDTCAYLILDITEYLREGDNTVAVSVDRKQVAGGFYRGAGLTRNVWLTRAPRAGFAPGGVVLETEMEGNHASVQLDFRFHNPDEAVSALVRTRVYPDREGVFSEAVAAVDSLVPQLTDSTVLVHRLEIDNPDLWSPAAPNRYRAVTTVKTPYGEESYVIRFGFRDAQFDENGLLLNGTQIPLRGVRLPSDLGALGTVWLEDLWEDRLMHLKEAGCNAVSMGAAAPAPELLNLCDRMGLLYVDGLAGRLTAPESHHPCLVDGTGRPDFALYGYAPIGALVPALFNSAGFPTDEYWSCRGNWASDRPMIRVVSIPSAGPGKPAAVRVQSSGDSGILYLDGRSMGLRKADPETGIITWEVPDETGEIVAMVYKNGRMWARAKTETTGAPVAVVWAEGIEETIAGMDRGKPVILRIPVEVVDAEGRAVEDAAPLLEFSLVGHGRILAVDAGDPASETPVTAQRIPAYHGKAAVYIYVKGDEKVLLTVRTPGLKCPRMEL